MDVFLLGPADLCLSQKYSHCFCYGILLQLNSGGLIGWSGEARSGLSEEERGQAERDRDIWTSFERGGEYGLCALG